MSDDTEKLIAVVIGGAVMLSALAILHAVYPEKMSARSTDARPFREVVGRQDCERRDEACMFGHDARPPQ